MNITRYPNDNVVIQGRQYYMRLLCFPCSCFILVANCDVDWLSWNSLRIAAGLCVWVVGRTSGWENETGRTGGRKKVGGREKPPANFPYIFHCR
jgi:hypothetical protein